MAEQTPRIEEFPLFFDPTRPNTRFYTIANTRIDDWNIKSLSQPLYLYQPNVEPNADGGRLKEDRITQRDNNKRNKTKFVEVKKEIEQKPEDEDWCLATSDGKEFVGKIDTVADRKYVIFSHQADGFHASFVDKTVRAFEEFKSRDILSAEEAEQKIKANNYNQERYLKQNAKFIVDGYAKEKEERKLLLQQQKDTLDANAMLAERVASDDDEGGDVVRSDPEDDAGKIDFDTDNEMDDDIELDSDVLNEVIEVSDVDAELLETEEEDGDDKKKKKKEPEPEKPVDLIEPAVSNEEIVKELMPEFIKEEEIVRLFVDYGMIRIPDIHKKFKDRLKTPEQKEHFRKLISSRLGKITKSGVNYLYLKTKHNK